MGPVLRFRLFGMPVTVQGSFILVAALITLPFAALVYGLTAIPMMTSFLIATAVAAITHLLWLTSLKQTIHT